MSRVVVESSAPAIIPVSALSSLPPSKLYEIGCDSLRQGNVRIAYRCLALAYRSATSPSPQSAAPPAVPPPPVSPGIPPAPTPSVDQIRGALGQALAVLCASSWLEDESWRAAWSRDSALPANSTRVFCISDLHVDQSSANLQWCRDLSLSQFRNDVLILAGDLGDSLQAVAAALRALRPKFRRVFLVVGNHDLWIASPSEQARYPDSLVKLLDILDLCDAMDVDYRPAEVAQGLFVAPLFSWYSYKFDSGDPTPGLYRYDKFCVWPFRDLDEHVGAFFIGLNRWIVGSGSLKRRPGDVVLTASHFLPRTELPSSTYQELRKNAGCPLIEAQIEKLGADGHVYGHTHLNGGTWLPVPVASGSAGSAGEGRDPPGKGPGLEGGSGSGSGASGEEKRRQRLYVQQALEGAGGKASLCCIFERGRVVYKQVPL